MGVQTDRQTDRESLPDLPELCLEVGLVLPLQLFQRIRLVLLQTNALGLKGSLKRTDCDVTPCTMTPPPLFTPSLSIRC